MNIVLLGAPGSGKGTQAVNLVKKYGVVHISTGNIFREEIAKKSDLGLKVEEFLKSGRLVPDELTIEVVKKRLGQPDCRGGFMMDGFPRTVAQAEALDAYLSSVKWKLDAVIYIELSEEEAVRRLSTRRQCDKCGKIYNLSSQPPKVADQCDVDGGKVFQRPDDMPETIKKRMMVFQDLTQPLISYYRGADVLQKVNGDEPVDAVAKDVYAILDGVAKAK